MRTTRRSLAAIFLLPLYKTFASLGWVEWDDVWAMEESVRPTPNFGPNIARMQEFSALLEQGLTRVFKKGYRSPYVSYDEWHKKSLQELEDEHDEPS
jgi:hypothetical protein